MTDTPPSIFDLEVWRQRLDRAKRAPADFLHAEAAAIVAERLELVARDLPRAGLIGAAFPVWRETVAAAPKIREVVEAEDGGEIAPQSLDLAVSALALHRADDPVGALARMRLALKPDGLMVAALFGGRTLHELRAAFAEAEAEVEGGLSPRVFPMGEIRDLGGLVGRAGYAMPVADAERITVDYATPLHLMRDLRAMAETNILRDRRRTPLRRATLMRACDIYAETFGRADGRIPATFEIVFLTGWAPGPDQPVPKRPGSAGARLADALGVPEISTNVKAGR